MIRHGTVDVTDYDAFHRRAPVNATPEFQRLPAWSWGDPIDWLLYEASP